MHFKERKKKKKKKKKQKKKKFGEKTHKKRKEEENPKKKLIRSVVKIHIKYLGAVFSYSERVVLRGSFSQTNAKRKRSGSLPSDL